VLIAAAFALASAAVLASGCGQGAEALSASALEASPTPSSTASSYPAPKWVRVSTQGATLVKRTSRRLDLPYWQLRRLGGWHLADATDRVAAFRKRLKDGREELWLLDAKLVVMRRALSGAVTPVEGWWISEVEVSDAWLAWVELAPGDDLVQEVEWRLYAAPLDRATLTVGEPQLVASALNTQAQRPLFDLAGSDLVWLSTTWASQGNVGVSRLLIRHLDAESEPSELYRSQHGMLIAVSTRGSSVVVTEVPKKGALRTRVLVLALSGQPRAAYTVPTQYGLSHWPAWKDGWLAWSPFQSTESTVPTAHVLARSGRVYRTGGFAADPLFVGPYLFYENGYGVNGIRALRLRDMTTYVVANGDTRDTGMGWQAPYSAPDLRYTYYTHVYLDGDPNTNDDNYSLIRIYRVP
jgi:hypothetical protein